jgi:hypothetical protein
VTGYRSKKLGGDSPENDERFPDRTPGRFINGHRSSDRTRNRVSKSTLASSWRSAPNGGTVRRGRVRGSDPLALTKQGPAHATFRRRARRRDPNRPSNDRLTESRPGAVDVHGSDHFIVPSSRAIRAQGSTVRRRPPRSSKARWATALAGPVGYRQPLTSNATPAAFPSVSSSRRSASNVNVVPGSAVSP